MIQIGTLDLTGHLANRERDLLWAVLDEVDDMVFVKDLDGVFLYNNRAHLDFIGKPRAEVSGRTDFDLFPAAEAEEFFNNDTRLYETESPLVSLHRARSKTGEAVLHVAVKTVVFGPGDAVVGLLGIVKRVPLADCGTRTESRATVMAFIERVAAGRVSPEQVRAFSDRFQAMLEQG